MTQQTYTTSKGIMLDKAKVDELVHKFIRNELDVTPTIPTPTIRKPYTPRTKTVRRKGTGVKRRPWTASDDDMLTRLTRNKTSITDISNVLKRTKEAVYARRANIKLYVRGPQRGPSKKWTDEVIQGKVDAAIQLLKTSKRPLGTDDFVKHLNVSSSAFSMYVKPKLTAIEEVYIGRKPNTKRTMEFKYVGDDVQTPSVKRNFMKERTNFYIRSGHNSFDAKRLAIADGAKNPQKGIMDLFERQFGLPGSLLLGFAQHIYKNGVLKQPDVTAYFGTTPGWENFTKFVMNNTRSFMHLAGAGSRGIAWDGRDLKLK